MPRKQTPPPSPNARQRLLRLWLRGWKPALYVVLALVVAIYSAPFWNPILFPPVAAPHYGVSFSEKRASELNTDWRANYTALLDDLHIRSFRLMSYWDIHERERGKLNFSSLDWQMDQAAKHGATVSMSIGLRQPRWPECHQPAWASQLSGNAYKQALYAYIKIVVQRYQHHPALLSWQLENESMNDWFGMCGRADRSRLIEEFRLVKSLSDKPVWMSLSDQHGLPIGQPWPDKFGFSVYRVVWSENTWPYRGYLTYPTPIWYHRLRATVIQAYTGRDIFIHELQLEPWGPRDFKDMTIREQDVSMSTAQIAENLHFAREIGSPDIYTWGSEWWYWRKVTLHDPSVWETVRKEFAKK